MYLNRDSTRQLGFCRANHTNDGKAESNSIKFSLTCHCALSCLSQHSTELQTYCTMLGSPKLLSNPAGGVGQVSFHLYFCSGVAVYLVFPSQGECAQ